MSLYRQGLTAEEIAADLDYPVEAVKLVIATNGSAREVRVEDKLVSDSEVKALVNVLKDVAMCGENESARAKAAIYLIEENRGRNDARVKQNNIGMKIDINLFNTQLRKAREAVQKAIDVDSKLIAV